MRLIANDVRTRVALSRLLVKIDGNPEYSRAIGIEDTSRFRSEAANDEKEVKTMLSILALIFIMIGLFKLTGLFFRAVGTLLGWIFGGIGWLILVGLAVTVFGLALIAVPAVLVIGLVALIAAAAS